MKNKEITKLSLESGDVADISSIHMVDYLHDKAQHQIVYAQLFRLFNTDAYSVVIPQNLNSIQVFCNVTQGSQIQGSTLSYDGVTITPSKWGMRLDIPKENLATKRNVLLDFLNEASRCYAVELDLRAHTVMLDLQTDSVTISSDSVGVASNVPIIKINSIGGATLEDSNFYNGTFTLTGETDTTINYTYSNLVKSTGLFSEVSNSGTLRAIDILSLASDMSSNTVQVNVCFVNPYNYKDLVIHDTVLSAKEYHTEFNNEVGLVGDIALVKSELVPSNVAILCDSDKVGYDVLRRILSGSKKIILEKDIVSISLYEERDFGLSNSLSVGLLLI